MQRSIALSLPLLALTLLSTGCIPKVAYTPNAGLIEELGYDQAVAEFQAVLEGVRSPSAFDVQVNPQAFVYHYAGGVHLYWGAVAGNGALRVLWADIGRTDVYENAKVFLISPTGHRVGHEYQFNSLDTAMRFCDLIASFKSTPPDASASGAGPAGPAEKRKSEAEQSPWAEEEGKGDPGSGAPR